MDTYVDPHLTDAHLTDEQFTGLLLGTIPARIDAHLAACARCAEEAERVSAAIGSFERQSRLWAERRAASAPRIEAPERQTPGAWLGLPAGRVAWAAAGLAMVLMVATGIARRGGQTAGPQTDRTGQPGRQPIAALGPARATPPPEVPVATLKADNALLWAIDGELSAEAAPSPSAYGLTVNRHPARAQPAKGISN